MGKHFPNKSNGTEQFNNAWYGVKGDPNCSLTHTRAHTHTHTYTHARAHTHTHTHTRMRTRTHAHTQGAHYMTPLIRSSKH
jgi:hypothetical protein